jgi:hypothetical protein
MTIATNPRGGACAAAAAAVVSLGLLCAISVRPGVARAAGSENGAAGQIPAFYEGQLLTINDKELPLKAEHRIIARGQHTNEIYATNDLDDEQDFAPVIDALPGESSFNPLWRQILIHFNRGITPHQLVSADEVEEAALDGDITLEETDEIYRCSVVAAK